MIRKIVGGSLGVSAILLGLLIVGVPIKVVVGMVLVVVGAFTLPLALMP